MSADPAKKLPPVDPGARPRPTPEPPSIPFTSWEEWDRELGLSDAAEEGTGFDGFDNWLKRERAERRAHEKR